MKEAAVADTLNPGEVLSVVERLERCDEETAATKEDRKGILEQAKEKGMEPKWLNWLVSERKKDREKRMIDEANREEYAAAVGLNG